MSDKVKCPYCDELVTIDHDDGFGYDQDVKHETKCSNCEFFFVFTTYILFHYESHKADCLNGGSHNMQSVTHLPFDWPNWKRCNNCDYEEQGEYLPNK